MKIILFSRKGIALRTEDIDEIFGAIERYGFDYAINRAFAENIEEHTSRIIPTEFIYDGEVGEQPADSVMVCYGGDGTLLEGVHRLGGADIPVVGINGGHLGFLALAPRENIKEVFEGIASKNLNLEQRDMLCVEGLDNGHLYALNEVAVQRLGAAMISVEAVIDDNMVATYNGDGVIISTPTGSTAYSLSAGGAIIDTSIDCMLLTPVCPHSFNNSRSIVFSSKSVLQIKDVQNGESNTYLTADGRINEQLEFSDVVEIRASEKTINLIKLKNEKFYSRVYQKIAERK